jgi:N-formylglutamate deformylase
VSVFELKQAESPLVISVPHDGALIPDDIRQGMTPEAFAATDRDLLISEVFAFTGLSCSVIKALYSRHVIDLNRPATGEALYANQAETELCPTTTFDRLPIYLPEQQPDPAEIKRRIEYYWQPYHQQLQALIELAVKQHGFCLLIDAHSIDQEVPRFFSGRLPDINVGTYSGASCAPQAEQLVMQKLKEQGEFSFVSNGRFKGGFITRQYGRPDERVHAIQLEHAKSCYLNRESQLSGQASRLTAFWQETLDELVGLLSAAN